MEEPLRIEKKRKFNIEVEENNEPRSSNHNSIPSPTVTLHFHKYQVSKIKFLRHNPPLIETNGPTRLCFCKTLNFSRSQLFRNSDLRNSAKQICKILINDPQMGISDSYRNYNTIKNKIFERLSESHQHCSTRNILLQVLEEELRVFDSFGLNDYNNDDEQEAISASIRDYVIKTIPATEKSIKGLEKVKIGRLEDGNNYCCVCQAEFDVHDEELEVTRLPCSHVYHQDCIVPWLRASHLCPLCRYSI